MKLRHINDMLKNGLKIPKRWQATGWIQFPLLSLALAYAGPAQANCSNTVTADVVALDQVFYYNRLGAMNPSGMIYALKSDVVDLSGGPNPGPGNAMLRAGKRPRPLVLRVNEDDCLEVHFTNWLSAGINGSLPAPVSPDDPNPNSTEVKNGDGPATRAASFHVIGMQPQEIKSDASNVGNNDNNNGNGLVGPGSSATYTFYAQHEGTYLAYSAAAMTGGEGDGGSIAHGLFAAVNVENKGSEWYRSQVTEQDLALAATGSSEGDDDQYYPVIDYAAAYPPVETRKPQEVLTLIAIDDGFRATMSKLTSNIGFTEQDINKKLIVGDFESSIVAVNNADGSATVTSLQVLAPTSPAAPYTWRIEGTSPHPLAGRPILSMLKDNEIVHSDLNAIIKGPDQGKFFVEDEPKNAVYPNRLDPFREFTVVFHDEIKAVQAFPDWYDDPVLTHTLHGVRDGFAINYGTGGIGSEIIANRLGLGPMKDCVECKYEEFFLTSWVLGDPAMVVDLPATINSNGNQGVIASPMFATKAYFPDDPSNVHHSYLNDRVKFRNLHAGPKEHHIFHLHAHQWLHSPDNDNSAYLDSQSIGPGSGYTYEIAHHGSGNRNRTPGDSIFHCHFYPHFAQGMWEFWRVHDVLETGTVLDANGRPAPGSRALPDNEIKTGTPIPALVPLPTMAMAPQPSAKVEIVGGQIKLPEVAAGNPGYPFYVAGIAGHRPPQPPLDLVADGGLPRHVVTGGSASSYETRLDFNKILNALTAVKLPDDGTPWERQAMIFHGGDRTTPGPKAYSTPKPDGGTGAFKVNGMSAQPGAPFADPCVNDSQEATGNGRFYHAAAIQLDVKMNKVGWHFPQQRILTLREDVADTIDQIRPPEPLFFRANSGDCITFHHTNLVPNIYEQDDFQVTTPTDTIGQHIHLVKFDVTSSDGSGNGWNYEDGTFSPEEVLERLTAINTSEGAWLDADNPGSSIKPAVCNLGDFKRGQGTCVQTTVQRWYADDVLNNGGEDRTLRTVFTHDHFGPSTHQHPGLYAGLVIEPVDSTWKHNETGNPLGEDENRKDGGPTSWQAIIEPGNGEKPYREFLLEMGDFSLAYRNDETAVNPPAKKEADLHDLVKVAPTCPGGAERPCPEAISADDPGTMTVNYRNEPLALRVHDGVSGQTSGKAGDLAFAFESRTDRAIPALNSQPNYFSWPLTKDVMPGDPFTPLLKAYTGDKVQIRILMGAHEEGHNFSTYGIRWLFEPSLKNSGYKNSQMLGISEHFEFEMPAVNAVKGDTPFADFAYYPGAAADDIWNGLWGIMRAYNGKGTFSSQYPEPTLAKLPSNPEGKALPAKTCAGGKKSASTCVGMNGVCPTDAPKVGFKVHAFLARDVLGGPLVYNKQAGLEDPGAILYIRDTDFNKKTNRLKSGTPVEPLILRANAGDCITLDLVNHLPADLGNTQRDGWSTLPMIVEGFNNNDILPSSYVGLTPQLLEFDALTNGGLNVGFNPSLWTEGTPPVAAPGQTVKYKWYAGRPTTIIDSDNQEKRFAEPVEYGAINLMPSDRIKHTSKGAIAAMIIEPKGSTWTEDANMRASATVNLADGSQFREHVLIFQDDLNLQQNGNAVPNTAEAEDAEDSGQKAFNYKTEPMWARMGFLPNASLEFTRTLDFSNVLSGDPETPVFTAKPGDQVRLRVLQPGGHARNHVFQLHGHGWLELPFTTESTVIEKNDWSEWKGSQEGIGPGTHLNLLLTHGAGGFFNSKGDYLFRDQSSFQFDGGLWGILRVE